MVFVTGNTASCGLRPPRVQIELPGSDDPVELPFVMGVLADLSGVSAGDLPPLVERQMRRVDADGLDAFLKLQNPTLSFRVPNRLTADGDLRVNLTFSCMADFRPEAIVRQVETLQTLLAARQRAVAMLQEASLPAAGVAPGSPPADRPNASAASVGGAQTLQDLLARGPAARPPAEPPGDGAEQAGIAEIDRRLSLQLGEILHHPDFQRLEGTWRGLQHLLDQSATGPGLQIWVLNVSKEALGKSLARYPGPKWDRSPIFKTLYGAEYDLGFLMHFDCVIADYTFDHSPLDVALLKSLARVAAAALCPCIAGAAPSLLGMDSWQELSTSVDLAQRMETVEYAQWRSLRESEEARYLALCLPRFLARLPYEPEGNPTEGFAFSEDTETGDLAKYTWSNSAFLMGANICRAFAQFGWCARIWGYEQGGLVSGLMAHTCQTAEGGMVRVGPAEFPISPRFLNALAARLGLNPLLHEQGSDRAAFDSAQSLHQARRYENPEHTRSAALAARLPHVFAVSRFAHCLRKMVYAKVGSGMPRDQLEAWLQNWILNYVCDPTSGDDIKARRPLADAKVELTEDEREPGYIKAHLQLSLHDQLQPMPVPMRLAMTLPASC